ncbi:hypothetical protein GT030_13795 [Streptomyces sp. SID1328]|nr:hypothetical protein [Streptomyces sp. SID1328]MYV39913.1 hypothetical protein [Streptomyces sp. SID1328]
MTELENLTVKHGVEFAVVYKLGPGPKGTGGQYFLLRCVQPSKDPRGG